MTRLSFTPHDLAPLLLATGAGLAAGMLIGAWYFLTLRWNVRLLTRGGSFVLAFGLPLMRFAVLAGLLSVVAACFGALPLLAGAGGILAARAVVIRWGAHR